MVKPGDIYALAGLLAHEGDWTYRRLAADLHVPHAVVQRALTRAAEAGLYSESQRTVHLPNFEEFALHALRFVAPATLGPIVPGIPAAWAAPPMSELIRSSGDEPPPVWPAARGRVRGQAVEPFTRQGLRLRRNARSFPSFCPRSTRCARVTPASAALQATSSRSGCANSGREKHERRAARACRGHPRPAPARDPVRGWRHDPPLDHGPGGSARARHRPRRCHLRCHDSGRLLQAGRAPPCARPARGPRRARHLPVAPPRVTASDRCHATSPRRCSGSRTSGTSWRSRPLSSEPSRRGR
jgi:hypothetical protein